MKNPFTTFANCGHHELAEMFAIAATSVHDLNDPFPEIMAACRALTKYGRNRGILDHTRISVGEVFSSSDFSRWYEGTDMLSFDDLVVFAREFLGEGED